VTPTKSARELARSVAWPEIIAALEQAHGGERWDQFSQRHGDWGRDAALWFGRRHGRLPLVRLGELAGGIDYAAVSVAIQRFRRRMAQDASLRHTLEEIERMMLNVEM
jgi:hypothetical protein